MPDQGDLVEMYGPKYGSSFADCDAVEDPKSPGLVLEWLRHTRHGVFVDYGCGSGRLLKAARELNWKTIGVEFDERVAETAAKSAGAEVLDRKRVRQLDQPIADVLHLGDVIEHLTSLDDQMPEILSLIHPGGLLIAQGPLENNANLFTATVQLARRVRPKRTEMPPYHVMLATARGQRLCFQRFGLEEIAFSITEVSWPAPSRLTRKCRPYLRAAAMFTARRISQALTKVHGSNWGNRYFYVGRCPAA